MRIIKLVIEIAQWNVIYVVSEIERKQAKSQRFFFFSIMLGIYIYIERENEFTHRKRLPITKYWVY